MRCGVVSAIALFDGTRRYFSAGQCQRDIGSDPVLSCRGLGGCSVKTAARDPRSCSLVDQRGVPRSCFLACFAAVYSLGVSRGCFFASLLDFSCLDVLCHSGSLLKRISPDWPAGWDSAWRIYTQADLPWGLLPGAVSVDMPGVFIGRSTVCLNRREGHVAARMASRRGLDPAGAKGRMVFPRGWGGMGGLSAACRIGKTFDRNAWALS